MERRIKLKLILQGYDDVQIGLRIVSSGGFVNMVMNLRFP
jgi:hypothetical protein